MKDECEVAVGDIVFDFVAYSHALVIGVSKYDDSVMEVLLLDADRHGDIELASVADLKVIK